MTATPHPVICWTFSCKNRKTPTLALDLPPLAPWGQGPGLDPVRDRDQDQARAVEHRQVELQVAEQVSTLTIKPDKTVSYIHPSLSRDAKSHLCNLKAFCPSLCLSLK